MARFLLTYLLHSSVLLTFVLLLTRFSVFRRASVRDLLCKVSLLTGMFTAFLQPFELSLNFSTPTMLETFISRESSRVSDIVADKNLEDNTYTNNLGIEKNTNFSWLSWLLGGSSLLFVLWRFGQAFLVLQKVLSTARPLVSEQLESFVKQQHRHVRLLSSGRVTTPIAVGRRTIVLPARFESQLQQAELKGILLHEVAHLKRADPRWNIALSFLAHLLFFQPLNFLVVRTWRQASEELCDTYAVAITSDPIGFAKSLVEVARHQVHVPRLVASAMTQTHLSQRVTALLSKKEQHMKRIYLLGFALLVVVGGCLLPVFTNAQVKNKIVVIDAAHGGIDPGAVGFANEAEVVLQVALKLKGLLESRGVTVVMTRENDISLSFEQRTLSVTDETAAYISIHANVATNSSINGVETSIFDTSESSGDKTFNAVRLAQLIQERLITKTGAEDRGITHNTFYVLRQHPDLAVFVSIGFVSNEEEANKLATEAYQQQVAEGMAEAIVEYLE